MELKCACGNCNKSIKIEVNDNKNKIGVQKDSDTNFVLSRKQLLEILMEMEK